MFLINADLAPFATIESDKADAMIDDAEAQAMLVAPCIADLNKTDDAVKFAAVKAILRSAILRWEDAGSGAITSVQESAGPFQQTQSNDTSKIRKGAFWPSEIDRLQMICKSDEGKGAFSVDTAPSGGLHLPWCSSYWGALYCSCGVDIAGYPIYELG